LQNKKRDGQTDERAGGRTDRRQRRDP